MKSTLKQLLGETLRVVIIESFSNKQFGLTVCIGYDNISIYNDNGTPYLRTSIDYIMQDLSLHHLGEIFIHQKNITPFISIPDYFMATDYGTGIIHLTPTALFNLPQNCDYIKELQSRY